jgi:hypothetical protein
VTLALEPSASAGEIAAVVAVLETMLPAAPPAQAQVPRWRRAARIYDASPRLTKTGALRVTRFADGEL